MQTCRPLQKYRSVTGPRKTVHKQIEPWLQDIIFYRVLPCIGYFIITFFIIRISPEEKY